MLHLSSMRAALLALLAILAAAAAAPPAAAAAARPAPATASRAPVACAPGPCALAYLRVRAQAQRSPAAAARLAAFCTDASTAQRERLIAAGARRLSRCLGHRVLAVRSLATVLGVTIDETAGTAAVHVHAVTLVEWADARGRRNTEGEGLDHLITLTRLGRTWLVADDRYESDSVPLLLERAGASAGAVTAAARRLERAARRSPEPLAPLDATPVLSGDPVPFGRAPLGYVATLTYDRDAAKAYADKYWSTYNGSYVRFSSDCANFGSQVMFAGGYPSFGSGYESGWWYVKKGTSSPSDDSYSHSWIACIPQRGAWAGKYADSVSGIGSAVKGDFVYYDWTNDGSWDHVAELVGTNSGGQKIVDAHTTDHYHVFWKLGTSATRYGFLHTRPSVVI